MDTIPPLATVFSFCQGQNNPSPPLAELRIIQKKGKSLYLYDSFFGKVRHTRLIIKQMRNNSKIIV